MSDNSSASGLAVIMWLITGILSIGSGVLAWDWLEPESFIGVIVFLILWGVFSEISYIIVFGFLFVIFDKK